MERLKARLGMKLYERKCACGGEKSGIGNYKNVAHHEHGDSPCLNIFQTGYDPKHGDIVYCEACYQQETA